MSKKTFNAEIKRQWIVLVGSKYQILYYCKGGTYFITTNGGFGQRDTYIEQIHDDEAFKLLNP